MLALCNSYKSLKIILLAILIVSIPATLAGQMQRRSSVQVKKAVPVTVGVFVQDIYDVDLKSGQFSALFYLWYRSPKTFDPSGFQIVNGVITERLAPDVYEIKPGLQYYSIPIRARLSARLNFTYFPFEAIALPIIIEDDSEDMSTVRYIPDLIDSGMASDIMIAGYLRPKGEYSVEEYVYRTDFGELTGKGQEAFSRAKFVVTATKRPERVLIKFFLPGILALMVGYLTLFVKPQDLDARFGLVIASVFFQISGFTVFSDQLPPHAGLTLGERLLFLNWGAIFVLMIVSVISLRQFHTDSLIDDRRCDRLWRWLFPLAVAGGYTLIVCTV